MSYFAQQFEQRLLDPSSEYINKLDLLMFPSGYEEARRLFLYYQKKGFISYVQTKSGYRLLFKKENGEIKPRGNEHVELCGLVINTLDEKAKLKQLCLEHHLDIPFPNLFEDGRFHMLWAFSSDGIGLVGTTVMRQIKEAGHKIYDIQSFENHLKGDI